VSQEPPDRADYDRNLATLRGALGDDGFAAAWTEGSGLSADAAVEMALRRIACENPPA